MLIKELVVIMNVILMDFVLMVNVNVLKVGILLKIVEHINQMNVVHLVHLQIE